MHSDTFFLHGVCVKKVLRMKTAVFGDARRQDFTTPENDKGVNVDCILKMDVVIGCRK